MSGVELPLVGYVLWGVGGSVLIGLVSIEAYPKIVGWAKTRKSKLWVPVQRRERRKFSWAYLAIYAMVMLLFGIGIATEDNPSFEPLRMAIGGFMVVAFLSVSLVWIGRVARYRWRRFKGDPYH